MTPVTDFHNFIICRYVHYTLKKLSSLVVERLRECYEHATKDRL